MHPIRIGTSGWNYNHWREVFYPKGLPVKDWFARYCELFDTVEINNTFYRLPEANTFEQWERQAPAGFLYAVKANRFLTHNLKLKNAGDAMQRLLSRAVHLQQKLGPILYQLPPRWRKNLTRLREFFALLPKDLTHVIEFRQPEWLSEDTYELLEEFGVCLCIHDIIPDHPRRITGRGTYLRFHGVGTPYGGDYTHDALRSWSRWIKRAARDVDVYAYFNNDAHGFALKNALSLREMVAARRPGKVRR